MAGRTGNYAAFYVAEPFNSSALGAHASKDFCYYNILKAWKGKEASFPFNDSHDTTYSVRDDSNWDTTLKPRLRERIRGSKNIVLFLSSNTVSSRALKEEIEYGINDQGLPIIVIYPEYESVDSLVANASLRPSVKNLWDKLPIFRDSMNKVPTVHIPMKKDIVEAALKNNRYMLETKTTPGCYWY